MPPTRKKPEAAGKSKEPAEVAAASGEAPSKREAKQRERRAKAPDLATYEALIAGSDLAPATKLQYTSRLRKLVDVTGRSVAWTLGHCRESWTLLGREYGPENWSTLRTFVNLALSLLSNNAEAAGMAAASKASSHRCWTDLYAEVTPRALDHYETNEPTERMLGSHVPWAEILAARDREVRERPLEWETLLLAFYTYLPPSRINFGRVRIYRDASEAPRPDTEEERETPNFVVLPPVTVAPAAKPEADAREGGPRGALPPTLTISAFKNKTARFPRSVRELPAELASLLRRSLEHRPRDWLFVMPSTGGPWGSTDSIAFGNWTREGLRRVFGGRPVTANTIRHSFATALDMNAMTPREKEATAASMMTSAYQLERYRMRLPPSGAGSDGLGRCRVVCDAQAGGGARPASSYWSERVRQMRRVYHEDKWARCMLLGRGAGNRRV